MWKLTSSVFLVWISILAISDWKTKQIHKGFTVGGILLIFIIRILCEDAYFQKGEWICSLLPGIIFCLMSFMMRGSLGLGDGICILGIGIAVGLPRTIFSVLLACFIAGIYAMGLVTCRQKSIKEKIKVPFIPFLLCGSVISFFW